MSQDRRIHSRVSTHVPARVVVGGETLEGAVENLGEGGVFFATQVLEQPVDEGSAVEVEIEGIREGSAVLLRLPGRVLRAERYFDGTAVVRAFAIRFDRQIELAGLTFR
jgi:PilZ domain-containing protein